LGCLGLRALNPLFKINRNLGPRFPVQGSEKKIAAQGDVEWLHGCGLIHGQTPFGGAQIFAVVVLRLMVSQKVKKACHPMLESERQRNLSS
jgi:hypothetical protein